MNYCVGADPTGWGSLLWGSGASQACSLDVSLVELLRLCSGVV